ncbi:MAG: M23 family metallopeptidase [Bacteroides sp.]|nr:M23 family metallopeptidase [Bacteroides sp.]MCM1379104.1 M23 family metallopeptidase [Bacteroides sp.]MCM1445802.1 M23 family metallopeptidase [Prevotella sp.]
MKKRKGLKIHKRFRLVFVNDNTLNTVWTLRLTRTRVWLLSGVCVAAIAALVFSLVVWSPISYLLPGYMKPEQRRTTVENTLRLDSLIDVAARQQLYLANISDILSGADSAAAIASAKELPAESSDTLLTATEAERAFVEAWRLSERNLSVLTPIVAEGMMFRVPVVGATVAAAGDTLIAARRAPVVAIQDGTVVDSRVDAASGRATLVIQHANDFISVYSGLEDVAVSPGRSVAAGQSLGHLADDGRLPLTIWHMGRRVALTKLLPI